MNEPTVQIAVPAFSRSMKALSALLVGIWLVEALVGRSGGVGVRAPKAWCGETLGAGGAFGVAAAIDWLADERAGACAVVTSVGFYGNASALVIRRPE